MTLHRETPVVLIVDDEPLLRIHAEAIIEDAGYKAVEAASADEAIRILEARSDIRIVITDIEMPGSMNGMALMAMIRNRWPPIELIVVSGHVKVNEDALPDRVRYIPKPYPEQRLVETMRQMLARG